VRIGLAWYGIVPPEWASARPELVAALRPALSLKARAIRVARVKAGTRVGYGGAWTATRTSLIATLPLGYADGYARSSWPGARALVRGQRVDVVGRVSMDAVTVDVTDVGEVGPEEEFVLIGRQGAAEIPVHELATLRGTIAWRSSPRWEGVCPASTAKRTGFLSDRDLSDRDVARHEPAAPGQYRLRSGRPFPRARSRSRMCGSSAASMIVSAMASAPSKMAWSADGVTQAAAKAAWWLTAPWASMPIMGWIDGTTGHVKASGRPAWMGRR
jgi:hypothetical protein